MLPNIALGDMSVTFSFSDVMHVLASPTATTSKLNMMQVLKNTLMFLAVALCLK